MSNPRLQMRHLACAVLILILALATGCKEPPKTGQPAAPATPAANSKKGTSTPTGTTTPTPPTTEPTVPVVEGDGGTPDRQPPNFLPATKRQSELLNGAMSQLEVGDLDTAAMHLLNLIGEGPASVEKMIGYITLAEIYMVEGKPEKGIPRLEEAEKHFPPTVELPMTLSELYEANDDLQGAATAMERAVAAEPNRLDVLARQVVLYARLGDPDGFLKANTAYETALKGTLAILNGDQLSPQQLQAVLSTLADVRDERLTGALVKLASHPDIGVVGRAIEAIVNSGAIDAIPELERLAIVETRAEIAQGLSNAVDYLQQMEPRTDIPMMPVDAP